MRSVAGAARVRSVVAGALLLAACAGDGAPGGAEPDDRPTVLVSVPPQAWLAERVAGDLVDLRVMVPPGASPHSYEPTMSQMRQVHRAAVYGALGHPAFSFERAWLPDIREVARSMEVVDTGAGCNAGGEDPHIWLDPDCALRMTDSLEAALARLLPAEEQAISEGAASARERIRQVGTEARELLAPHRGRSFMVFHPAWGHFARSFGLRQVAIEAEGKAPSPAELQRLVRRVSEEGIGTVFVQPQFSREAAEIVAAEANARVILLDPLRRDWDEGILETARELAASFGADRRETGDRGRTGS